MLTYEQKKMLLDALEFYLAGQSFENDADRERHVELLEYLYKNWI